MNLCSPQSQYIFSWRVRYTSSAIEDILNVKVSNTSLGLY